MAVAARQLPGSSFSGALAADLARRQAAQGRPIRVGLIGSGEMGTDIVTQCDQMAGITVAAIAEINIKAAERALAIAGRPAGSHVVASGKPAFDAALKQGLTAITEDAQAVCTSDAIDVVIDATGRPAVGAEIGLTAMEHGKHLVMMNVEADVTIGAYLQREAKRLGVVYTLGAGDEPSSCMELINFVSSLGYPIVAAGKGKNNPLNIDATPDAYMDEARRRNMNPRMLVEFVDGSKTMVEMAAIANATGLVPDCPGMHGPQATLPELEKVLCPKVDGGLLSRKGVVDYSIGKGVAPGVFVIAEMAHPRLRERMHDLKLGAGPYYTFYRPYHLTSLEVPLSCARAVLYGTADMQPLDRPAAEVCAVAKKDLKPGDALDAIGEYTYRAWIMTYEGAAEAKAVPCGLLEQGKVTRPIRKGELLTADNVALDQSSRIVGLRRRQDELLAKASA
ncbi:NAD(P)H-dependent oxidoreductase [Aestuariivirga sp. YIM B02566]|uniref:Homoserine dehydrogenase n=1 Tax=Taklimakanibacter albus TaxID=2800327 RepID=A0ACC5RD25_9HYPH|nr:homoserine dehydrogenase [Aestuariivirga sp. YIM B02566]MBK1870513.1 homoserine dehydrogenase [Aestuariivirga sp. YIM B02566]